VPAVREAPEAWRGETGEAASAVDRLVHSVDKLVVYVCGGGDTVNAVRDVLVKKGMDRKSVKWEKFW
jgi:NAD(P)H-flavin reductase